MRDHVHLVAHIEHRAGAALGPPAGADVFAEGDEQRVEFDPVVAGQFLFQDGHRFLGRLRVDVAPAIRDAVDVDVDADARLAAGDAEHEVRAFRADAFEREQGGLVARELAVEFIDDTAGDAMDLPGFGRMEGGVVDQGVDGGRQQVRGFSGRASFREELAGGGDGDFVTRANRDDASDDEFEHRIEAVGGQLEQGGPGQRFDGGADAK